MDVTISGRHMDVTDAMEKHIRQHLDKLPRLDDEILSVTVTLDADSPGEKAEVIAKCHRDVLVTHSSQRDLYASIDEAFARMERRISKLHNKMIERRNRRAQKAAERIKAPE